MNLQETPENFELFLTMSGIIIMILIFVIFRKLEIRINNLLNSYTELKKQSEGDEYVINYLTKEKEHLADLNDKNEREINLLKNVIKSQESLIKELANESALVETKVYDAVFSLPIHESNKPV